MNAQNKTLVATIAATALASKSTFAATSDNLYTYLTDPLFLGFGIAILFVLISLYAVNKSLNTLRYQSLKQQLGEEAAKAKTSRSILTSFTEPTSAEDEAELLTDHDYDGIHELDNDLPPWWKYGFYISIGYAVVYLILFFGTGDIQTGQLEYEENMKMAEANVSAYLERVGGAIDESNVTLLLDDADLNAGKEIFVSNCAACHMADGGGQVGPNLTDEYWLHGGGIVDVFSTIKYGVPAKGMIPWEDQLGPKAMQQVASYVLSLQGTTPANPKAAEGELWKPTEE